MADRSSLGPGTVEENWVVRVVNLLNVTFVCPTSLPRITPKLFVPNVIALGSLANLPECGDVRVWDPSLGSE